MNGCGDPGGAEFPQLAEPRPRLLLVLVPRGEHHQADQIDGLRLQGGVDDPARRVRRGAELRGFSRQVHLHEHVGARAGFGRGCIDPADEVDRIYRMDDGERRRHLRRLVRLEMADQMPADSLEIGSIGDLLKRFLDLVLTEIHLAGRDGGPHVIGWEGLGNRDQCDAVRVTRDSARGGRDACPDGAKVVRDDSVERHAAVAYLRYDFSASKFVCASLAFGPVGASLR